MITLEAEWFGVGFPAETKAFSSPKRPALSESRLASGYMGMSPFTRDKTAGGVQWTTRLPLVPMWNLGSYTSAFPIHLHGVQWHNERLLTTSVVNRPCTLTLTNNDTEEQNFLQLILTLPTEILPYFHPCFFVDTTDYLVSNFVSQWCKLVVWLSCPLWTATP